MNNTDSSLMSLNLDYEFFSHCCTEKYGTNKKWMKDDYNIKEVDPKHISVFSKIDIDQLSGNPFGRHREKSNNDHEQFTVLIHQYIYKMEVITTSSKHITNGDLVHYVISAHNNLTLPMKSEFVNILDSLSSRETEVLTLLAKGHSMTSIAKLLSLSPHTIDSHRINLCSKLKVRRTTELAVWAYKLELLDI